METNSAIANRFLRSQRTLYPAITNILSGRTQQSVKTTDLSRNHSLLYFGFDKYVYCTILLMLQRADTLLPKFKVNWKCFWIWCVLIVNALHLQFTVSKEYKINNVFFVKYWIFGNCYFLNYLAITNIFAINQGRLPFERKIRLEWNARNGTVFSRCGVSPSPRLSRLEENNKIEWREKRPKCTGSSGSLQMVQDFSSHFGWNGKRGIPLRISIFSRNFPMEWAVPFEFPTGIFGFCWQMVNALGNTI